MKDSLPELRFFDTNILVIGYDITAGEKHTIASQLLQVSWKNEDGCLSTQVLEEFYVTVTRKLVTPLDSLTARQLVDDLSHWRCFAPQAKDVVQAIDLQQIYRLSFWDAMILHSATQLGCKNLFSEDFNHGQFYGAVQAINPFKELR